MDIPVPIKHNKFIPWMHFNQPRNMRQFACAQGMVMLTDSLNVQDGGFCYYEPAGISIGVYFTRFMEHHNVCGTVWKDGEDMGCPGRLVKVSVPRKAMLLYDARLLHMSIPPMRGYHMSIYTTFQPRSCVPQNIMYRRQRAFVEGRMTGTWCYGDWFKVLSKYPRFFGNDDPCIPSIHRPCTFDPTSMV